ncbi:SRPBCC domain-containing protein [Terrabacter lapilli]|uniref:SRPBCC domain-containing protein n=1 Tax=Terrabacter lapilli TaxID=436231 RepID=A0ABN2S6J8_9MICO
MNDGTVTHTRVFSAPRELVFRCLLTPEHLTRFWGPAGMSAPLDGITVDPRPGGVFETVMVADDGTSHYTMRAIFDEILEPERIAWTELGSGLRSVSTFTDLGDGRTEVTIVQSNMPKAFLTPKAQAGFRTSLDKLETYLRAVPAAPA